MIEKVMRFWSWMNNEVHLGKLWGLNALVFAVLILFLLLLKKVPGNVFLDIVAVSTFAGFLVLYLLTLIISGEKLKNWMQRTGADVYIFIGLLAALVGWLLYSLALNPAETWAYLRDVIFHWDNPLFRFIYKLYLWVFGGIITLTIVVSIFVGIKKRLGKK